MDIWARYSRALWTLSVAHPCTALQSFARCAMHWYARRPTQRLPRAGIAPAPAVALFREAKRVGGRGISDFPPQFFLAARFFWLTTSNRSTRLISSCYVQKRIHWGKIVARVIADFKKDWHEQLLEQMRFAWGDQVDQIKQDEIPFRFFDSIRRAIQAKPRKIKISDRFAYPAKYEAGWLNLQRKIKLGESLRPHLSKDHLSLRNSDGLLDDWGVHHFHLGLLPHSKCPDLVERTPPVVFAFVTDDTFYAINTFEHEGWTNTEIVETLHQNWPEAISRYVIHGIPSEPLTDMQRKTLRRKRAGCFITVEDGTVYAPIGGPISAAGMAVEAVIRTDICHRAIEAFQVNVESSAEQIVAQLRLHGLIVPGDLRAQYVTHEREMAVRLPDYDMIIKIKFDSSGSNDARHYFAMKTRRRSEKGASRIKCLYRLRGCRYR